MEAPEQGRDRPRLSVTEEIGSDHSQHPHGFRNPLEIGDVRAFADSRNAVFDQRPHVLAGKYARFITVGRALVLPEHVSDFTPANTEPHQFCRRLTCLSCAAMFDLS